MALRLGQPGAMVTPVQQLLRLSTFGLESSSVAEGDCVQVSPTKLSLPSLEPSPDADMITQILLQQHNPFHAMESSLQLSGIALTPHLVRQTLLRLKNVSKIALSFFTWAKNQPSSHFHHYQDDDFVASYNLLIDILGKVHQFDAAWRLIIELDQQNNIRPTSATFLILIRRLISAGFTRQAIRAFDDMECFTEKEVDRYDFCYLLDTLCKYGYVKVAMEIFNNKKQKMKLDVQIYTILIYGCYKTNGHNSRKMAERLLNEMVDKGIEPNAVTYNVILNGICRRASLHPEERFERTVRDAENVFDEMRNRGIEPDATSYSIVLHVYSRAHKPELTLGKFKEMKDKGIYPTVATYTSVVKCLCSCGSLEDAEVLLNDMAAHGVSPSSATYNCFFKEYRGRKDADSALKLYRKMKQQESTCLLPGGLLHTYNILLAMFVQLNRMDIVKEIWDDMKASSCPGPDLDSYTLLIHELCDKRRWKEACQYFVEMIEKGILPQKVTFETLYRGLIQSDMLRTWRRLKKKLEEESINFGTEFKEYLLKPYRR